MAAFGGFARVHILVPVLIATIIGKDSKASDCDGAQRPGAAGFEDPVVRSRFHPNSVLARSRASDYGSGRGPSSPQKQLKSRSTEIRGEGTS